MKTIRTQFGFTLMELMVTVVIVGILAAIAYPTYMDYVYRSRRSDGQNALLNLANYMEHFFTENNTYTGATLTSGGVTGSLGVTNTSREGYYTVSISSNTGTAYTLTATPTGSQAGDTACPSLTVTNTGLKGPSTTCWGY